MAKIKSFPNIESLSELYVKTLKNGANKRQADFIAGELRRMAILNSVLGKILVEKRLRKSWISDLEQILLKKKYSSKELKSKSPAEKKAMLVKLLFPRE